MEFLRLMFKQVVSRFPKEPNEHGLTSISTALFALQECSGMHRDYLGKRLGLTRARMIHLETYGKPNQALLERLKLIADEYGLHGLAEYFANQVLLVQAHRRKKLKQYTSQHD